MTSRAWAAVPKAAKVGVAIVALLGILAASASQLVTYASLPERVDVVEVRVSELDSVYVEQHAQMRRVESEIESIKCILVAENKGDPIIECL